MFWKRKKNEIILYKQSMISSGIFFSLIISLIESYAFYIIINKVAPNDYDATLLETMLTITPIFFIGIIIVLLIVLLISQKGDK